MIENINTAERAHSTAKMLHTLHNGRLPHTKPPTLTSRLPAAVATNQPPIIMPLYLGGATLLTKLMPMGDNNNSPKVRMR